MASDVQPPHKRARISSRDEDDYLPGNITEIEVTNFMTYTYLKSKPGSRLNLVIGPNGTGKSSLVCAIGIGLAGEPQLLGRAGNIGDYVTRGEEYGIIKISLRGNSPDDIIVITRKIYKQNKSDWLLNGRAATKKDVQDVVRRFNIQVNNLTQFLPQDRVCEFAKMSPIQLLEETEKAVGDPELYEHHVTLKKYSQDLKQHQATVAQLNSTLARGEAENAELEKDVERVQQRNSLFEKAKLMEKKLPWLKYDRLKEMYTAAKEKRKEAKEALDLALEKVAEYKGPFMEIKQVKEKKESACKKLSTDIAHNEKSRREIVELENRLCIQSRAKLKEIEEISKREATRLEKIKKAKQDLEDAEAELANLPPYEIPREALVQLNNEITEREVAVTDCKRQVFEKADTQRRVRAQIDHFVHRIQEIQNVKNRRLRILKDSGVPNIYEAYKWVEDHRPQFKRDVYGPVLLEVNIPNRDHAAFVEGHVAFYIWKAFITQDAEDRDLLVRNLKQYDVPIINFTGGTPDGGPAITREMEALGINARLDEVFTAPKVVKNVLIGQFGLNQSFIGSQRSNNKADEISHLGVRDLWTPENHYRWQVSRYGGPMSASVNAVRPPRLLSEGVDAREFTELEQKKAQAEEAFANMENEIKAKKTEQKLWEDEAAEFHKKREEIISRTKDERKKRQDMLNRIEQRKLKLESIQNEEDSDTAENRLRLVIKRLANERMEKALQMKDLLVEVGNLQIDYSYQRLMVIELEAKLRNLEKEMRAHEAMGIQAQKYFDSCKSSVARYRGDLESAKRAAEEVAQITPELQLSFAEMPGTIEELEFAIDDCVAQARAVLCPNPNVLQDYERRCKQIAELKEKLENANKSLDFCISETERIKIKWLTTLRDLVGRINHTFGRNFREMAVAGEVSLDEHGADFDKYGILIKVKFRENGELQVLSAHHQSGGERSVSTILYLVSLQDLTHCPFRVVDEINQGMDPYNERKMFQQLVRAASQPNTPQCFLLTPKLLPDLDYSESCTVLFIMNGPWIEKPSQVWSSGEPWKLVVESLACQEAT